MLKLKREKILVSLVAILMIALVVGNIYSLATDDGNSTALQLTSTNTNKSSNNTSSDNETANVGAEVGATNSTKNNTAKNTNTNTNTNTNSAKNTNTNSTKNTNSSSSSLPYAGSNTSIIFIVIALAASAIYAYKKVSDYNV